MSSNEDTVRMMTSTEMNAIMMGKYVLELIWTRHSLVSGKTKKNRNGKYFPFFGNDFISTLFL